MNQLYYGIWKLVLMLPLPLKILLELLVIIGILTLIWPIIKYIIVFIIQVLILLNKCILGGARYFFCYFARKSAEAHNRDEKIGERGRKIDNRLQLKAKAYKNSKRSDFLKKKSTIIILSIIYIAAVLPAFKLEKMIEEYYLDNIYFVNKIFSGIESKLTGGIENYPDLFKEPEKEQEEIIIVEEEIEQEPVYLILEEGTTYANIRGDADLNSMSVCVVSKEDQIIYQNIYEHDDERYWLKVTVVSQNNVEGWISAKLIDQEILNTLNLS